MMKTERNRKTDKSSTHRWGWTLPTGFSAALLVMGLSLLLSRLQVQARPATETTALEVEKDASPGVLAPGDILTYTIEIKETGAPVTLWMTDTLPDEVAYIDDSLQLFGPGSAGAADGVITWTADSVSFGQRAVITFSAETSSGMEYAEVVNTAEVTGTGELITASKQVVVTGLPPHSQIRSPSRDAYITRKGSLTVNGIAWREGTEPPYLTDDLNLSLQRVGERSYYVKWNSLPSAEDYILQEATQRDFGSATLIPVADTEHLITKGSSEDGTYYYQVQAVHPDVDNPSRWSNVEAVTVPWTVGLTGASASSISREAVASESATVQVRIDDGDWQTATVTETAWGGWDWTYEWPLPEERDTQHVIQARASEAEGGFGPVDAITVTLDNENYLVYFPRVFQRWPPTPYPPTLHSIDNPDQEHSYTVSWSYTAESPSVPDPTSYTLQEATNSDFTDPTEYDLTGTSKDFSGKEDGTYYYRVQGRNEYGAGEWSNVRSTTVKTFSYFDDFSDPGSGWPSLVDDERWAFYEVDPNPPDPHDGSPYPDDGNGYFIARRSGGEPFAAFTPGVAIPSDNYEIEVDTRWWDARWGATYQILFGANRSLSSYYAVRVKIDDVIGLCRFSLAKRTDGGTANLSGWIDTWGVGCGQRRDRPGTSWNHWRIRREDDWITVYVNGDFVGQWEDPTFGANRYFGVRATLYEGFTPSKPEYDNWSVELLD